VQSYTTFGYTGLSVTGTVSPTVSATVTFTLANTGSVDGAEVAQLYISHPAGAGEPPKLLKNFEKVVLAAGASAPVTFTLAASDVAIFDVTVDDFVIYPGTYGVMVGSSSADIRVTGSVVVTSS
jgi:beta-glucosidase